jgi:hypothetical protein
MFTSWLHDRQIRPSKRFSRRYRQGNGCGLFRPQVEQLEGRCLPAAALTAYGQLPLSFEANEGQADPSVNFLSRGNGYALFLTPREAVLSLRKAENTQGADAPRSPADVLRMQLIGGNMAPAMAGLDQMPGVSNYFMGNDTSRWHTNIPNYARVAYRNVYPGIDLIYDGNRGQLEYDFVVAPGANPGVIQLAFQGAQNMAVDAQGNLVLHTAGGDLVEQAPALYQDVGGIRQVVAGHYLIEATGQVGFAVAAYNTSRPLVIDPTLTYSTYLGGSDGGLGIAVDQAGNAYVTGSTDATDFPTANAFQNSLGAGGVGAFVTKLSPDGKTLVYSTYLGGSSHLGEEGAAIAVDASGNAYVTGFTSSTDFPTMNALQPMSGGGKDAFVAELNASGTALVYSTYLGGSSDEEGKGIAVDAAGNAHVTGFTFSSNFPTMNALQPMSGGGKDAFVAELSAGGTSLIYSTYLGGSDYDEGDGIAVDSSGTYVVGGTLSTNFPTVNPLQASFSRLFVAKLNSTGTALVYSTYLGNSAFETIPSEFGGSGIAVDSNGSAYVTTATGSHTFPVVNGVQTTNHGVINAFVAKFNAAGSALVYSTYLGGSANAVSTGIAVDSSGNAYVTGFTVSRDFPTARALQPGFGGGTDAFVTELNAAGSALVYSTYLGGSNTDEGHAIAVDASGNVYVTGNTNSSDFPTANALQPGLVMGSEDAFITKIPPNPGGPAITTIDPAMAVEGSAGFSLTINGSGFTTNSAVQWNGQPLVPTFVSSSQLQVQIPASLVAEEQDATIPGVTIIVSDPILGTGSQAGFNVPDAPLVVSGVSFQPTAGLPFDGPVASFIDTGGPEPVGKYSALILWGDGTSSSVVNVASNGNGGFLVTGQHTYSAAGPFAVTITVFHGNIPTEMSPSVTFSVSVGPSGTPNQRFVSQAYLDLLQRKPEPGGLAFWSGLLDHGTSRFDVVRGIEASLEYRVDVVQGLYHRFLLRDGDLPGLNYWVELLGSGATVEQVAAGFTGSAEYFQRRGGGSNDGFLDALYHDVFNRAVDPEGRLFSDQALASGYTTGQIATVLFSSPEYRQDLVQSFYPQFLGRGADGDGLSFWSARLQHGATDEVVIAGFVASDEFFVRA